MALPPKDDPTRPIALAVNAARVLGTLCLVMSALVAFGLATMLSGRTSTVYLIVLFTVLTMLFPAPGILYLVFASAMNRRKQWAAICVLVIAGIQGALLILSLIGNVMRDGNAISLGIVAILLAAVALLIMYTVQALAVIRREGPQQAGFEPIMPPPPSPVIPAANEQRLK